MAFFNSAINVLQTLVIALGAGLGIWGAINLLEGYGNDNPGAKSQGMKQLMAGGLRSFRFFRGCSVKNKPINKRASVRTGAGAPCTLRRD